MEAVIVALIVACANIAILVMAQAESRVRELAVRSALGGSRQRLNRLLAVETLLTTGTGGILGLLIARPEGRIFFVNAQTVAEQINALVAQHRPRVVALDMSRVPDIEYSALQMLMEGEQRAPARGHELWLVGCNPGVLEVVRRSGLADRLGRERLLFNARVAIERYQARQRAGTQPPAAS